MAKQTLRRRSLTSIPEGWPAHVHPVLQRVYAARGVVNPAEIERRLAKLLHPSSLSSIDKAASLMASAIRTHKHITVAGDYDCDGATGSATAVRGMKLLGATRVKFIVPNRFTHGYGLSPELVDAMDPATEVIVTVDSGVSSLAGVAHAKAKGMTVVITDHHLPGDVLPDADAIVNPNLQGDSFPSKHLAGVGVMFYLLIAIRAKLREEGYFGEVGKDPDAHFPDLTTLLDYVAIGTVADLVPLDTNNRILVDAGLRRMREGKAHVGVKALVEMAGKSIERLVASDIGFSVAPRLNAAGRLENMSLGVETLLCDDPEQAKLMTQQLEAINQERRELQATMVAEAEVKVVSTDVANAIGVVVYDPHWHSGVVGLVASKLKEELHRPVFALAPATEGSEELRGSGRSIPGFHLRDALAIIDARHPGLLKKFGGHAMAAGLSLLARDVPLFTEAFDKVATEHLDEERLNAILYSDGELAAGEIDLEMAYLIREGGPWGQAFPEPVFDNVFHCVAWRAIGLRHLRLQLRDPRNGNEYSAIFFHGFNGTPPPVHLRVAYELSINEFLGRETLQFLVRHLEPAT